MSDFLEMFKAEKAKRTAEKAKENSANRSELERGWDRGVAGMKSSFAGAGAIGSTLLGDEEGAQQYIDSYQEYERQASENPATVDKFFSTDPKSGAFGSVSNFAGYTGGLIGSTGPSLIESAGASIGGAMIGGALVPAPDPADVATVPIGAAAGFFGKKYVKKLIADKVEQYVKDGIAKDAAERMANQAVKKNLAAKAGAGLASSQATAVPASGQMYGKGRKDGYDNPYSALALGQLSGLSEAVLGSVPGAVMSFIGKSAAKDVAKEFGLKEAAGYVYDLVTAAPKAGAKEGIQEAFQASLESVNETINDPKKKLFTRENFMNWAEAFAGGAFIGGLIGSGSTTYKAASDTKSAIQARRAQLEKARTKGWVSKPEAAELGIAGENRPDRKADLERQLEEVKAAEAQAIAAEEEAKAAEEQGETPPGLLVGRGRSGGGVSQSPPSLPPQATPPAVVAPTTDQQVPPTTPPATLPSQPQQLQQQPQVQPDDILSRDPTDGDMTPEEYEAWKRAKAARDAASQSQSPQQQPPVPPAVTPTAPPTAPPVPPSGMTPEEQEAFERASVDEEQSAAQSQTPPPPTAETPPSAPRKERSVRKDRLVASPESEPAPSATSQRSQPESEQAAVAETPEAEQVSDTTPPSSSSRAAAPQDPSRPTTQSEESTETPATSYEPSEAEITDELTKRFAGKVERPGVPLHGVQRGVARRSVIGKKYVSEGLADLEKEMTGAGFNEGSTVAMIQGLADPWTMNPEGNVDEKTGKAIPGGLQDESGRSLETGVKLGEKLWNQHFSEMEALGIGTKIDANTKQSVLNKAWASKGKQGLVRIGKMQGGKFVEDKERTAKARKVIEDAFRFSHGKPLETSKQAPSKPTTPSKPSRPAVTPVASSVVAPVTSTPVALPADPVGKTTTSSPQASPPPLPKTATPPPLPSNQGTRSPIDPASIPAPVSRVQLDAVPENEIYSRKGSDDKVRYLVKDSEGMDSIYDTIEEAQEESERKKSTKAESKAKQEPKSSGAVSEESQRDEEAKDAPKTKKGGDSNEVQAKERQQGQTNADADAKAEAEGQVGDKGAQAADKTPSPGSSSVDSTKTPSTSEPKAPPKRLSEWEQGVMELLNTITAFKGASFELSEADQTVKVTRPDGLSTKIHFGADELLDRIAKRRGEPQWNGAYIFKSGRPEDGNIYLRSDTDHTYVLNHEVVHWLEDAGIITPAEVKKYGGREGLAEAYGEWAATRARPENTLFEKIYDFFEQIFDLDARFFKKLNERVDSTKGEAKAPTQKTTSTKVDKKTPAPDVDAKSETKAETAKQTAAKDLFDGYDLPRLQELVSRLGEAGVDIKATDRDGIIKELVGMPKVMALLEQRLPKPKPKAKSKPPKSPTQRPKPAPAGYVPQQIGDATVVEPETKVEKQQEKILNDMGVTLRVFVGGSRNIPGYYDGTNNTIWLNRAYIAFMDEKWKREGKPDNSMAWGLFMHEGLHAIRDKYPKTWKKLYEWVNARDEAGLIEAGENYVSDFTSVRDEGGPEAAFADQYLERLKIDEALMQDEQLSRYIEDRAGTFEFWNELGKSEPGILAKIGQWFRKALRFAEPSTTDPDTLAGQVRLAIESAMKENGIETSGSRASPARTDSSSVKKKKSSSGVENERKARTLDEVRSRVAKDYDLTVSSEPIQMIDGRSFSSLDPDVVGTGLLVQDADAAMQRMMTESLQEAGVPEEIASTVKAPSSAEVDYAFRLTDGSRYWYELSATGFVKDFFGLSRKLTERLIDIVAGTSGGQKPTDNLRVAVASMAQDMQGRPVSVGTRDESSLTAALSPAMLETHKFGNFSDTMQVLGGLRPGVKPLPTIDLQMAKVFGVQHAAIASDPRMYEAMSRFLIKLRDAQNAMLKNGEQPYESWQIQALLWVAQRDTSDPDSFNIGMPKIVAQLKKAGIPTPGGKITEETLMDPRTSDVLAPTSKIIPESYTATIGTWNNLTKVGKESAEVLEELKAIDAPWARKMVDEFEKIQRRTMRAFGNRRPPKPGNKTRQKSVASWLLSVIMNKSPNSHELSRVDTDAWGTFEGAASPNIRFPLNLGAVGDTEEGGGTKRYVPTKDHREQFLSVLGKYLKQESQAASQFIPADLGSHDTFSILVRRYDKVGITESELEEISDGLGRPISYKQVPNGWQLDINIRGFDKTEGQKAESSDVQRIHDVMQKFALKGAVRYDVLPRLYESSYIKKSDYNKHIRNLENEIRKNSDTGGSGEALGYTEDGGASDYAAVVEQIKGIATKQESAFRKWTKDARERVAKRKVQFGDQQGPDSGQRYSPGRRSEPAGDGRGRDQSRKYSPLEGAPSSQGATGPDPRLVDVAEKYARENGIDLKRQAEYVKVDEDRAKRISKAYEDMPHDPQDPKVKEAYQELAKQTKAQYDALVADGYTFTFYDNESDPYAGNPMNAMRDLRQNKSMAVYGTSAGFGTKGVTSGYVDDNPLLVDTGVRWKDQNEVERPVNAVELFRAVHDTFGHGLEGSGFRARGEENAWQAHVRLFTGSAIGAMTTGTRGQNSWLNFGPYGEKNKTAKVEDTIFADQKTGLMPEWTWTEGRAADYDSSRASVGRRDIPQPPSIIAKVLSEKSDADVLKEYTQKWKGAPNRGPFLRVIRGQVPTQQDSIAVWEDDRAARLLLDEIDGSPEINRVLYRGTTATELDRFVADSEVRELPRGFSTDKKIARKFSDGGVIVVEQGARGVSVGGKYESEVISRGPFEIISDKTESGSRVLRVRQLNYSDTTNKEIDDGTTRQETGRSQDDGSRAAAGRSGKEATAAIRSRIGPNGRAWSRSQNSRTVGGYGVVASYKSDSPEWNEVGVATPNFVELQKSGKSAAQFASAINAARESQGKLGASVYVYPEEDYRDMRLFLTEDGKAGFALKDSGEVGVSDIVSVFNTANNAHRGVSYSMIRLAVEEGGNTLDAFDTFLPVLYSVNGFKVISRTKWNGEFAPDGWSKEEYLDFNNGEPDVVFMAYDPKRTDIYRHGSGEGKVFDDYDEAVESQRLAALNYLETANEEIDDGGKKRDGRRAAVTRGDLRDDSEQDRPGMGSNSGSTPSYGRAKEGAVSYVGRHYSKEARESLDVKFRGTGIPGAENRRLRGTDDDRIKKRIYFYIDTAGEIKPEMGVGSFAHEVKLDNLYDPDSKLIEYPGDPNKFESAIVDAGYDGYISKSFGMAVLLGPQHTNVPVRRAKEYEKGQGDRYSPVRQAKRKRDPEVTKAAQDLKAGLIDRDQYQRIVDMRMPLRKFDEVPIPASKEDMLRGLGKRKAGERLKRDLIQNPEDIAKGTLLEARLDIPAYDEENVWIVSLHEPRSDLNKGSAGRVVAYTPTSVLRNVTFGVTETAALNIAAGKPKSTIATMRGEYVPMTAKQAYELAETNKDQWVEIGMNPVRHTYFYDKNTQAPVESAEEVVQVGGMVLAKNPVLGKRENYRYSPSRKDDLLDWLIQNLEEQGVIKPEKTPDPKPTGTKYARTEGQRTFVGDSPRESYGPRKVEERQQKAIAELAANPGRPYEIIAQMDAKPAPLTDMEDAILNARIRQLKNDGDIQGSDRKEWLDLNRTVQRGHSEWGYAGHAAQAELADDFSVEGLTRRHTDHVGEDPKSEKLATYADLADRIDKMETEKADLIEKLAQEAIARQKAEENQKPPPKEKIGTKRATLMKKVADGFAAFQNAWSGGTTGRPAVARQAESSAFKKWFGNSKVVDDNGDPLVMYHGTDKDFNVFENRGGKVSVLFSTFDVDRKGFFFAKDKGLSLEYGSKLVPVYLSIQKPANFLDSKEWPKIKEGLVERGWNERYLDRTDAWELFDVDESNDGAKLIKDLKSMGYDGAIIEEPSWQDENGEYGVSHVAFDNTQIKSATGNVGTFDATNPDIRYSPSRQEPDIKAAAASIVATLREMGVSSELELESQVNANMPNVTPEQMQVIKEAWDESVKKTKLESPLGDNPDQAEIGARAKELMKLAIEAGHGATPGTWQEVVDVVHAQLSIEVPGIFEYDTMQAMSDYGEWTALQRGDVVDKIRAIRGKVRQTLKIEDTLDAIQQAKEWLENGVSPEEVSRRLVEEGRLPKSTGREQATPDSIERDLIAEFNKLKKGLPVSAESREGQLKTALSTAKTAGRNRLELLDKDIELLEEAVAKRTAIVKSVDERTPLKPDTELAEIRKKLEDKRKRRDELKAEYETIFPPTKKQRLETAEAQTERARESIKRLQDKLRQLKEGKDISPTRQPDLLPNEIRTELKMWQERFKAAKQAAKEANEAQYEGEGGALLPPSGRKQLTEAQKLKASERMLREQIDAIKADIKALENGTWAPASLAATTPTSELKTALKAELDALRAVRKKAQEASPAYQANQERKYWERYRKGQEKRLAFWEKRRVEAAGGILPVPRKKRTITEEAILDKNLEIEKLKYEAMYEIEKAKRATWNAGQWIGYGLLEATSLIPKTLMLGMEMSFVLRQGFFYLRSHPIKAFMAVVESMPAVWSQRYALASVDRLESRPNAKEYLQGGVEFTKKDGPQAKLEEMYQSAVIRWLENTKTPWLFPFRKWVAAYGAFERGNRTFANIMKADLYDIQKRDTLAARELFKVSTEWTEDDVKETGRITNIFSGRGTGLKGGNPWLDFFFLARRWTWSRIQADFIVPFQLATPQWLGQWNADRGMRVSLAKLYIQTLMGHATKIAMGHFIYSLLAGDDEEKKPTWEWDTRSSDAWATKVGETRFKDDGGLMPAIVLASRLLTGTMKTADGEIKSIYGEDVNYGGKAASDFIIDFARYKMGTGPAGIMEWFSGKDAVGRNIAKKDDPTAVYRHIVWSRVKPLTWGEIASAEKELGVATGTLASLEALFGTSVSTYGDRTTYRNANEKDREDQIKTDLRGMKWDSPDPAYEEFLNADQKEAFRLRREERKGALMAEAFTDPKLENFKDQEGFDKAVESRDEALKEVIGAGMTYEDIQTQLIEYWKQNHGSAYERKGNGWVLKAAIVNRLRVARDALEEK
jgi:hypothetical protein